MTNALILAAGLGTRLKPMTNFIPKALVPVGGRPLLQILIDRLKAIGVTDIVVNVHHFSGQIIDFLFNSEYSKTLQQIHVRVSDESRELLDTGGAIKKAAPLFPDAKPFLVHNVDILSNLDLRAFHNQIVLSRDEPTTLIASERPTSRYLLVNDENLLVGWTNITTGEVKSPYKNLDVSSCRKVAFSGIQAFNPRLLPLMESWPDKFSIIDFYLSICDKEPIIVDVRSDLRLLDVGKLDTLSQAENFITLL